jgi:hypothetical protein
MEPVFMILGQSAATAACMAIDAKLAVQDVPYEKLRERILKDGQILHYQGTAGAEAGGLDPAKLKGVVVDDDDAKLVGEWRSSHTAKTYVGDGYQHDNNSRDGKCSARFETKLPASGEYEVRFASPPNANRCSHVQVEIQHASGTKTVSVNEKVAPPIDGLWFSLGTFAFSADKLATVTLTNKDADGYVVIDAVQFLPTK